MSLKPSEIRGLYSRVKSRHADRDLRMANVLMVRQGKMHEVYPEVFPEGPYNRGIVANMVDVAARDLAEVIAPLPAFNCSAPSMVSDAKRQSAEKRTLIANGFATFSRVQRQAYTAADQYVTYGFVPAIVEPDYEAKMPRITFMDARGAYAIRNRWGDVTSIFFSFTRSRDELCAMYPEAEAFLNSVGGLEPGNAAVEVVRYHDKDQDVLMLPYSEGFVLEEAPNKVGRVCAVWIERPGIDDDQHGQFDDVLAVQVAKARFALLALEATTKAVQAPIAVPLDMQELSFGADSLIKTQTPEKVRRLDIDVPSSSFAQQQVLDEELRQGSRYPQARNGNVDGSIVTGRGVEALMSGFDSQVRTAQAMFAIGFTELFELAFAMDEKLWGDEKKSLRGNSEGVPFEIEYTPSKDINGDYTIDVQYGLMAGLDPNRALTFGLQARGDGLISQDFLRRQLPFNINATQEEQKLDIEETRRALKEAMFGYAQAIPVLAQQGQDPGEILRRLALVIQGRQAGRPIEEVVVEAFEPAQEPPGAEVVPEGAEAEEMLGSPSAGPSAPGGPGQLPPGINALGQIRGVAPGQAGQGPGGRPDVMNLLAGMTQGGQANLQANISRQLPI